MLDGIWLDGVLDWLLRGAACRALLATALTVAAAGVARFAGRPALAHGLAVLALLALVTPPVVDVPLLPSAGATIGRDAPPLELPASNAPTAPYAIAAPSVIEPPGRDFDARALALGAWLLGSLGVLGVTAWRGRRFGRLLRHARPPSPGLAGEIERLARQLGLSAAPRVAVVEARVSPMLWPSGLRLVLILPAPLLRRLAPDERTALLLHELAHVRRRDPWVRRLETLAAALFWWLPTTWWLRRCLRDVEEQCCDAWVVWAMPRRERAYADALLRTVDFLSGARFALPPQASGAGHVHHLKQRLTMIMEAKTPRRLSAVSRLSVIALAAVLLPVLPTQAQEKAGKAEKAADPELREALERIELESFVEKFKARHGEELEAAEQAERQADTVEKIVRQVQKTHEDLQKDIDKAVQDALRATEQFRGNWKEKAWQDFKINDLMEKGDFRAAHESIRKALENHGVAIEGEAIQRAVRQALEAAKSAHRSIDTETLHRNLQEWMHKNPDALKQHWEAAQKVWEKHGGATPDAWKFDLFFARPDGHGHGEAESKAEAETETEAETGSRRERRVEKIQVRISDLEKELEALRAELRQLQKSRVY